MFGILKFQSKVMDKVPKEVGRDISFTFSNILYALEFHFVPIISKKNLT